MKKFVLWGHHLKDYIEMFDLSGEDLSRNILEYGSGATSFNVEMLESGHHVTSCDRMFSKSKDELMRDVFDTFDSTINEMKVKSTQYQLKSEEEIDQLITSRREGIDRFFSDYEQGVSEKRYIASNDRTSLPFNDYQFGLGLVSHHLFVNYDEQGVDEHVQLIEEMVRVAGEVRVFPLLDKNAKISSLLGPVMLELQKKQLGVEIRQVNSMLKRAGNAMLRVMTLKCDM